MKFHTVTCRFVLAAVLAAVHLGFAFPLQAASIKIGVISPVTGPVALDGESFRHGAELSLKEINAAGGVLGSQLQLIVEDGECKPNVSANAAEKLIVRDSVPVLVGAHCSPATAAVIPLAERYNIPFLTGISSAPSLTAVYHKMFFRLVPTEAMSASAAVPYYLEKFGFKSIAFFALNDEWGRQAAEANAKLLEAKGVRVLSTDYFLPGESEFDATLSKIKSENPDALFVAANAREAILIAKAVKQLGMKQRLLGVGAWVTSTFMSRAGDAGLGWIVISQYVPAIETPQNNAFVAAFRQAYNAVPDKYAAAGHDAIMVVADAIKRAGAVDSSKIRDALEKTNLKILQGVATFDNKHQAYTNEVISENRAEGPVVLKFVEIKP